MNEPTAAQFKSAQPVEAKTIQRLFVIYNANCQTQIFERYLTALLSVKGYLKQTSLEALLLSSS